MAKKLREFIDKDHKVMGLYYGICEKYNGSNAKSTEKNLKKLIDEDPDFFDSYLLLYDILQDEGSLSEAEELLDDAYDRARALITDKEGNWPDNLEWGWLENRHTCFGEENILKNICAGIIVIGHNWNGEKVLETQKKVLDFFGFKAEKKISWNWQFTKNQKDESNKTYIKAAKEFRETLAKAK